MELKYEEEINTNTCDLDPFSESERKAYRFVFQDIDDSRNFDPPYYRTDYKNDECRVWALSFFDSLEESKAKIRTLKKHTPNIQKKLGTHIAEGNLDKNDGITNKSNGEGHFSLFEYKGVDLSTKFNIVGPSI